MWLDKGSRYVIRFKHGNASYRAFPAQSSWQKDLKVINKKSHPLQTQRSLKKETKYMHKIKK
jgi:hypothetical protein